MVFPRLWYRLRIPSSFFVPSSGVASRAAVHPPYEEEVSADARWGDVGGERSNRRSRARCSWCDEPLTTPRDEGLHGRPHLGAQSELEYGPSGSVRGDPQSAIVRLDDRTANRQTHPHTIRLGGEERAEYPIDVLRVNSCPRICDRHDYEVSSCVSDFTHRTLGPPQSPWHGWRS